MRHNKIENYQIGHSPTKGDSFKIERDINNDPNIEVSFSHRHSFHAVYWIHEGSGVHAIDFQNYEIKPNRVFYIKPEQVHFLNVESKIRYSALQFSEEFMLPFFAVTENILNSDSMSTCKDLNDEEQKRLRILFDLIYNEFVNNLSNSTTILQSEINILVLELDRMGCREKVNVNIPDALTKFRKLINELFLTHRQVKDYATQIGITPNYLNVLAQKHFDESALTMINKRIILEIKRQLIDGNDDISTIAYRLNFDELSYFSRFFKRETGLTPNEFRVKMNKLYQK